MTDDLNARVRGIVETALADLVALGMKPEGAAGLLATQGLVRMSDLADRRELLHLVDPERFEDPAAARAAAMGWDLD